MNINNILQYLPQLHCDLKISGISTGYKVTSIKILLTFILKEFSKFHLNVTEEKYAYYFTHQCKHTVNSIHGPFRHPKTPGQELTI